MSDTVLAVTDLVKNFHGVTALEGVSIDVRRGEFLAVVGPSGCGKTTLLKIIGGFEVPTSGQVILDGRDMTGTPAAHRPTSMVFQDLALFPHKTVADNIGFPLKLRKLPRKDILDSVNEMMGLMDLNLDYRDRYPRMLSGGERQRVCAGPVDDLVTQRAPARRAHDRARHQAQEDAAGRAETPASPARCDLCSRHA